MRLIDKPRQIAASIAAANEMKLTSICTPLLIEGELVNVWITPDEAREVFAIPKS